MKRNYGVAVAGRSKRPRRPVEIEMTPMIDVIFLLLVFFLATSSLVAIERMLPSSVSESSESPAGSAAAPSEPTDDALDQVIVKLKRSSGTTVATLNGTPLARFEALPGRLTALRVARADVPVIVNPSDDVVAGDVVRAYDWARQAGLTRVYLATRP